MFINSKVTISTLLNTDIVAKCVYLVFTSETETGVGVGTLSTSLALAKNIAIGRVDHMVGSIALEAGGLVTGLASLDQFTATPANTILQNIVRMACSAIIGSNRTC